MNTIATHYTLAELRKLTSDQLQDIAEDHENELTRTRAEIELGARTARRPAVRRQRLQVPTWGEMCELCGTRHYANDACAR